MPIETSDKEYGARILAIAGTTEIIQQYIRNNFKDLDGNSSTLKINEISWHNNFGENRGVWTDKSGAIALTYLQAICAVEDAKKLYQSIQNSLKQYKEELADEENKLYSQAMAEWQSNQRKGQIRLGGITEDYKNHLKRSPNSPMVPPPPPPPAPVNKITNYFTSVAAPSTTAAAVAAAPSVVAVAVAAVAAPSVAVAAPSVAVAAPSVAVAAPSVAVATPAPALPSSLSPTRPYNYEMSVVVTNTQRKRFEQLLQEKQIADRHAHGQAISIKLPKKDEKPVRYKNSSYATIVKLLCNNADSPTLFQYVQDALTTIRASEPETEFYTQYRERNRERNMNCSVLGIIELDRFKTARIASTITSPAPVITPPATVTPTISAAPTTVADSITPDPLAAPTAPESTSISFLAVRDESPSSQHSAPSLPSAHDITSDGMISPDALSQVFDSEEDEPSLPTVPAISRLTRNSASSTTTPDSDSENHAPTWTARLAPPPQEKRVVPNATTDSPDRRPPSAKRGNFSPSPGRYR